jgi:hypothetical protein
MKLRPRQSEFAKKLALLILFAFEAGYEVTISDVQSFPKHKRHRRGSFHYKRLAADINLFKDGVYLKNNLDHLLLGEFWKSIGGTWGGDWEDGNHYSLGE